MLFGVLARAEPRKNWQFLERRICVELRLMFFHQGNGVLRMGGSIFKPLFYGFDESANNIRISGDVIFHRDDAIGVEISAKVRIDEGADLLAVLRRFLKHRQREKISQDDVGLMIE